MAYLFDTNAISEALRQRPNPDFMRWLQVLPREDQFTSTVVVAELYVAANRSAGRERWLRRIEEDILSTMTILPFELECARMYGRLRAQLLDAGTPIGDIDTQIAATALYHRLIVVTANIRHFERVDGLQLYTFTPGKKS
ncbi:MAG: hypothetical protein ETSY1_09525, partial [Candidatus Entotheonella factor]